MKVQTGPGCDGLTKLGLCVPGGISEGVGRSLLADSHRSLLADRSGARLDKRSKADEGPAMIVSTKVVSRFYHGLT